MAHTAGHRRAQMVNRQNAIKSKAGRKRAAFISGSNVSVVSINMFQWLKVSHKVFGSSKRVRKNLVVGRQDYTKELHG